MSFRKSLFSIALVLSISTYGYGQSEVTFAVNLKPQIEDSTFIPGRDFVKIVGDLRPINTPTPFFLKDEEPIDSVYSITIRFSSRYRNQILTYNYELTSDSRKLNEVLPRSLQLQGREVSLDTLYFNAFPW
ncbi:MAG: hypothetical protein MI700_11715 [Balneolales bacterium]|nr:hypothetical protein [Balneolales bacterium]